MPIRGLNYPEDEVDKIGVEVYSFSEDHEGESNRKEVSKHVFNWMSIGCTNCYLLNVRMMNFMNVSVKPGCMEDPVRDTKS